MLHTFRIGQLVALAQTARDLESYEVVQVDARDAVRRAAIQDQGPVKRHRSRCARGRDQAAPLKGLRQPCNATTPR